MPVSRALHLPCLYPHPRLRAPPLPLIRARFSAGVAVVLIAGDFGDPGTNRGHHPTRLSGGVLTRLAARPPDAGVGRTVLQLTAGLTGLIRALITFPPLTVNRAPSR